MGTNTAWIEIAINASKALDAVNKMNSSFSALRKTAVAAGAAITVIQSLGQAGEFEELGMKVRNVEAAFKAMGQVSMIDLRTATKGIVDDLTLMQQAVKFSNFNLPLEQMATFLQFAAMRAAQAGESIDYMVESIVIGLGRGSIKVLDNLQINVKKFTEMVKEGMTYAEAMALLMQEDMAKGAQVTASGFAMMSTEWTNFKNNLAQSVSEGGVLYNAFKALAGFLQTVNDGVRGLNRMLEDQGQKVGVDLWTIMLRGYNDGMFTAEQTTARVNDQLKRFKELSELAANKRDKSHQKGTEGWHKENNKIIANNSAVRTIIASYYAWAASLKKTTQEAETLGRALIKISDIKPRGLPTLPGVTPATVKRPEGQEADMSLVDYLSEIEAKFAVVSTLAERFSNILVQSVIYGKSFGEAMVAALKAMVVQLVAAITKALILAAIITAFPVVGQALGMTAGFGSTFKTVLRGSDIFISGQREEYKRGRTE